MSEKLTEGKYSTMEEFAKDIELVFSNCRTFNPAMTYPVNCADTLERMWKKEWAKAMEKRLPPNEKKQLAAMTKRIIDEDLYVICLRVVSLSLIYSSLVHGYSETPWIR